MMIVELEMWIEKYSSFEGDADMSRCRLRSLRTEAEVYIHRSRTL